MHAYPVAATTLLSRRSAVREYLHGAYWVLPTLGIVIGLGGGGPAVDNPRRSLAR